MLSFILENYLIHFVSTFYKKIVIEMYQIYNRITCKAPLHLCNYLFIFAKYDLKRVVSFFSKINLSYSFSVFYGFFYKQAITNMKKSRAKHLYIFVITFFILRNMILSLSNIKLLIIIIYFFLIVSNKYSKTFYNYYNLFVIIFSNWLG